MKKSILIMIVMLFTTFGTISTNGATVINKEDASLFSRKSIYSEVGIKENIVNKNSELDTNSKYADDVADKFSVVIATKTGNKYTNNWSNYSIEFEDSYNKASDVYDFYADGMKFDFGIYFKDYSRIAVYYTRLAKDLSVVCANFAPGKVPDEVEIAGEIFKHVRNEVKYPYGVELYDYYLRAIDGKLMVIETYTEEGHDISQSYIDKFEKVK